MNTVTCTLNLLSNPDFTILLGWCLAAAMAVGGIIDESSKKLRSWIFAAIIFAAIEGGLRYIFRLHQGGFEDAFLCESTAITINTTITYIIGIAIGWLIVFFAKKYGRSSYEQTVKTEIESEETKA